MSPARHRELFAAFASAELEAGGPDPQLAFMLRYADGRPLADRLWAAGAYCAVHCVPTAMLTLQRYPEPGVLLGLERWLGRWWRNLPVRPEMKSARVVDKRARCLRDFSALAVRWAEAPPSDYEHAWHDSIAAVKYYGRYMAIKFVELARRILQEPALALPDLRARQAWSPRRTLGWFYPSARSVLDSDDVTSAALAVVHEKASALLHALHKRHGVALSWFQLQVLLCEYREAWAGGFYPGGTHDEELVYYALAEPAFSTALSRRFFQLRAELFPPAALGECGGWGGLRAERMRWLKREGQVLPISQVVGLV